jgi:hypothetical protein
MPAGHNLEDGGAFRLRVDVRRRTFSRPQLFVEGTANTNSNLIDAVTVSGIREILAVLVHRYLDRYLISGIAVEIVVARPHVPRPWAEPDKDLCAIHQHTEIELAQAQGSWRRDQFPQ